jgi:hypothetical protein
VDTDSLANELIELFYKEKIYSPFLQLSMVEDAIEEFNDIEYKPLISAIKKHSEARTTCISCGEKTTYPCHIINTKALTMFRRRNWKEVSGTSRGSGHNPDKKSDKEILVDGLINSMDGFNLSEPQETNLRHNLERVRPELLVALTGAMIVSQEHERPMDRDVYKNEEIKMWQYLALDPDPKFLGWDAPNMAERLGLEEKDLILERGLDELLPLRDRNYIKNGTIPTYKEKIDIEDYLAWWKVVNRIEDKLPEAFKGIKKTLKEALPEEDIPTFLHLQLQGQLPIPCGKNKRWHIDNCDANRRLGM